MEFDSQQTPVIEHRKGNALVLAGAGSGKTASVTERAARLIAGGMQPNSLVMMTFTNKAAREMRERIHIRLAQLGIETNNPPAVTTFHSFGQRIITKNTEACGRMGMPSLMGEDDQDSLLLASFKKYCPNDYVSKAGMDFYDKIRNNGLSAGFKKDEPRIMRMLGELCNSLQSPVPWEPMFTSMLDYEEEKRKLNALDYHDLLILPIHALKTDPYLRDKFRKCIVDLTVDEAQDTNLAQYELVKLIAPPEGNQTVIFIGDPDQSIHRWRGANPKNLGMFNEEYRPVHFLLEHNYRSQPRIVVSADQLIKNNPNRFEKSGIPMRPEAHDPMSIIQIANADQMSDFIAKQIKQSINQGVDPSDIAILFRTNKMANLLEPSLLALDIPYKIYNGQDLLSRVESKLLLSAIRFAVNPHDIMAFKRLSDLMPGVGAKLIEKVVADIGKGETIYNAILRQPEKAQASIVPMLMSIVELRNEGPTKIYQWMTKQPEIRNWLTRRAHEQLKASKFTKPKAFDVWKKYNRKEELSADDKKLLSDRKVIESCQKYQERLNESLVVSTDRMKLVCKTIDDRCKQLPANNTIADQWFEANNVIAAPPDEENKTPSVHLMTLHSSKGLEWKYVFIPGMSDGIMPFNRGGSSDDAIDPDHMEDERRLAYVGMTRARDHLYMLHCDRINLMDGKGHRSVSPSPFIKEAGLLLKQDPSKSSFSSSNETYSPSSSF